MASALPSRILVVDDDGAVRASMEMLLSAMGLDPILAADGAAALAHIADGQHDLAMIDLGLPGMSDGDLVRKLRLAAPDMPIVIVSGWSERVSAARTSADLFLEKPVSRQQISDMLDHVGGGGGLAIH